MSASDWTWPAHHERGHAVIAAHFGHRINFVWIGRRDGGTNLDIYRAGYGDVRQYLAEKIIINEAGRAAVDHLSGYKHEYPDWNTSDDYKLSWKRAVWLSGNDEGAARLLLQTAQHRAESLVRELWAQVQAVALALLGRESMRLSGREVREIIERVGEVKAEPLPVAA